MTTILPAGRSRSLLALLGITVIGFLLRIYDLGEKSFWVDELISLRHAATIHDLNSFLTACCGNMHPPLYFLALKFWSMFGDGEFYLRVPSVMFGTAVIPATFLVGRELAGTKVALLTSFLVAVSPFHLQYDREVRNYSLLTLLVFWSLYFFVRSLRTGYRVHWTLYGIVTAASLYVHYHAFLVLLFQLVFFLARLKDFRPLIREAVLSQLLIGALGVWWLPALVFQLDHPEVYAAFFGGGFPIVALSWLMKPAYLLYSFSFGQTLLPWNPVAIVGIVPFAVLGMFGMKRLSSNGENFLFVGLLMIVPFVAALLISETMPRYFVFLAPVYYLVIAQGLLCFQRRWAVAGLLCLLLIPISVSAANYYQNREFHILAQADPWREVSEHIRKNARMGDCFVAIGSGAPMGYYLDNFEGFASRIFSDDFRDVPECMSVDGQRRTWLVTGDSSLAGVSNDAREWLGKRYELLAQNKFFLDPDYEMKSKFFNKEFLQYRIIVSLYGNVESL